MPASGTATATRAAKAAVAKKSIDAPGRSPQIEQYLNSRGFTWEFREGIPLKEFDQERSLRNQARVGKPIDEATVVRYVAALENGDIFPGIIAALENAKQGLLIVDGNHRFESHRRWEAEGIDTYLIIGAKPQAITLATFEANTKHGLPTNESDRIHQALWLMDNNVTAEDAAKQLGLKPFVVRNAASLAAVDRRADENGISRVKWDDLADAVRKRLGQITTDEGFKAMAQLVIDTKMGTQDVSHMVGEMNLLRSSAKQAAYVAAQREAWSHDVQTGGLKDLPTGPGRRTMTPKQRLVLFLSSGASMPPANQIAERIMPNERPELIAKVEQQITALEQIRDALKK